MARVLVVNPGSTSTRLALFVDGERELEEDVAAAPPAGAVVDALPERLQQALDFLDGRDVDAVVGRGGLIRPVPSGTLVVTPAMEQDARDGVQGQHASNLGCLIAAAIGRRRGVPAFVVDPVAVDEMLPEARCTGLPELRRRALSHALNLHAVARMACRQLSVPHSAGRFAAAHLGGGFSVAALAGGRILDTSNANSGGPFSPTRAGALPTQELIELCFASGDTHDGLRRRTTREGGLRAHLGTDDARVVEARIAAGDSDAALVYGAMAYQTSKEIGAMAAALSGRLDAVLLTGGLAHSAMFCGLVESRVAFLGPVLRFPGGFEMEALAAGAERVLSGEEKAMEYPV